MPVSFSISNFSHCFVFSGVLVYDHLYVNMKNEDKVLIDVLLENHGGLAFVRAKVKDGRLCHDYRFKTAYIKTFYQAFYFFLCMVSGHSHITKRPHWEDLFKISVLSCITVTIKNLYETPVAEWAERMAHATWTSASVVRIESGLPQKQV